MKEKPSNSAILNSFYGGKKRITCFSISKEGVKPEWEDEANVGGVILSCQWDSHINEAIDLLSCLNDTVNKILIAILGCSFPHVDLVEG